MIRALDDATLDEIAAMQEAKDDGMEREYYVVLHMIQTVLRNYDPESPDLGFAERYAKLVDTLVTIKERQAKLRLLVPPGENVRKLEFTDPRVQYLLKERFRDAEISTIRGTLALLFKYVAGDPELTKRLYQSLPERLQAYVTSPADPARHEPTK